MPSKKVTVMCLWCKYRFLVQIEAKYKSAEVIPQGGDLPKDQGENASCPKCGHQLHIIWRS
jgi:hypothetical protein